MRAGVAATSCSARRSSLGCGDGSATTTTALSSWSPRARDRTSSSSSARSERDRGWHASTAWTPVGRVRPATWTASTWPADSPIPGGPSGASRHLPINGEGGYFPVNGEDDDFPVRLTYRSAGSAPCAPPAGVYRFPRFEGGQWIPAQLGSAWPADWPRLLLRSSSSS